MQAILFDLDGVLTDTAHFHYKAWKTIADQLQIPFSLQDNERLKGVSRGESFEIILSLSNLSLSEAEKIFWCEQKNELYKSYIENLRPNDILEGILPLLNYLKTKNLPLGVASSSKNALPILEKLELMPYFQAIVDGNELQHSKPNPEVFLRCAERLGVNPENCWVIEDAEAGVQAARSAKMRSVGIGNIGADHTLNSTKELLNFFSVFL